MNDVLHWLTGGLSLLLGGDRRAEALWTLVTGALSAAIVLGYGVIAVNWYFQSRLARHADSRLALRRLRNICLCCAACGTTFYLTDVPWMVWRFYDLALGVFAFNTWSFVVQMHGGLRLVDERLAQVDELERAATRYREIAELLPHMVWTATAHGAVDFSNQVWRDYVGAADRTWLDAVHPEDRYRVLNLWNAAVAARQSVKFEARLGGRDGYRTFLIRATTIVQGEAIKWLGACADIEDQKRLTAEKDAQARQKSFFLNALSHDLRAPLHNVLLNAQLLKMSGAAGEAVDGEAVDMIVENAVAAGDLVARLLDFARVGAQERNVTERVSMPALLSQITRRFTPLAQQKGLYLIGPPDAAGAGGDPDAGGDASATGDAADIVAVTDRQKLERIISNLVENAIKYTAHGGVTLELALASSVASAASSQSGAAEPGAAEEAIVVRVSDTGIGIPPDKAAFLFEEFFQVNNYERDRSKGFGMGLAICRSLASHINADVRLAASGPRGSCFEVVVPRDDDDDDANGIDDEEAARELAGAADDDYDVNDATRQDCGGGDGGDAGGAADPGGGPDRGGRPLRAAGDRPDPSAAGLCGV